MAKGIFYVCSTAIPYLVKIGKSGTTNFEERMRKLEKDGYNNANALKRQFAIEVDNYDEKEKLLDAVLSKIQIRGTTSELFALDIELAKQLLSSLKGTPIYPVGVASEEVFEGATEAVKVNEEEAEEKETKKSKPKLDWMMTLEIVKTGDVLYCKKKPTEKGAVTSSAKIKYNGKTISLVDFARKVTGWEAVNAYRHLILEGTGKTLLVLREEKMKELGI